jgi:hypothetical protein
MNFFTVLLSARVPTEYPHQLLALSDHVYEDRQSMDICPFDFCGAALQLISSRYVLHRAVSFKQSI